MPTTSSLGLSAWLPENARVETSSDGTRIGALDLARLLGATKYWHAELRKLELRTPLHRIQLTEDNPFVLLDDRTLELPLVVRSSGGQLQVPVALIDSLPHDTTLARLIYDSRRALVLRVPAEGLVRTPRIENGPSTARLTFPSERPEALVVMSRSRAHFRVHFDGLFVGDLPDSMPPGGLLLGIRPIASSGGSAFELALAPGAGGFRIETSERGTVDLQFAREPEPGFERFAAEGPEGPPRLKVIVLDPGHGGADPGVSVPGEVEKDLTLALARMLAVELQHRLGARVVLTRTDDRGPSVEERAETANRVHADVVLSLHFDAAPSPSARGATAYCPPATFAGLVMPAASGPQPVLLLPWRDVATRHAVRSRELAEAVLSEFELRGLGPTRLREQLPYPLLGVDAPGLLLECATLTSATDRARVSKTEGLADLARAIAAGLDAYRRAE